MLIHSPAAASRFLLLYAGGESFCAGGERDATHLRASSFWRPSSHALAEFQWELANSRSERSTCCNVDGSANASDVDLGEAHAQGPQGGRAVPPTATINAEPQSGVPIHGNCFITCCIPHHFVTVETTFCCCARSSLFLRLESRPPWRLSHA